MEYRKRRPELIQILSDAANVGLKVVKLDDENPKGTKILLEDIDPFSFFASFNRGTKDEERKKILQFMKDRFTLEEPVPIDFTGIPTVNPMKSRYFGWAYKRKENDIETLWNMAEAAITKNINEISPDTFNQCLKVSCSSHVNITMGLFWFRPDTYIAFDDKNVSHFKRTGVFTEVKDWQSYLGLIEKVKLKLGVDFPAISHDAHLGADKEKKKPSKNDNDEKKPPSPDPPEKIKKYALNTILYGPPGTGKTYSSIRRAVEIIEGDSSDKDDKTIKSHFDKLVEKEQVRFITFHQSYSYEDFVEGIRPCMPRDGAPTDGRYECRDGVFKELCNLAKEVKAVTLEESSVDLEKVQIWKMSLGDTYNPEDDHIYPDCIAGRFIAHGAGRGLDFSKCESREDIQKILEQQDWSDPKITLRHNVSQISALKIEMQSDDLVIVTDGNRKFRAIGKISGDYFYDDNYDYKQKRHVTWIKRFDESQPKERILKDKSFSMLTLYKLKKEDLKMDALGDILSQNKQPLPSKYVLIIDEINRGNISKILGELITLLEPDKRLGEENGLTVTLPYSQEAFGVPANLYILGTMNTADKSIALVDVALRRRFEFEELMPNFEHCNDLTLAIKEVLKELNKRIVLRKDRDHQIGHSYFMKVKDNETFNVVFKKKIIPLLQEYFWNDWEGLRYVLGENNGGMFISKISGKDISATRNKWQWFSDKGSQFDYLDQLKKNYGILIND